MALMDVPGVMLVECLWALLQLLSVYGDDGADGVLGGDGGGDAVATATAVVCVC